MCLFNISINTVQKNIYYTLLSHLKEHKKHFIEKKIASIEASSI